MVHHVNHDAPAAALRDGTVFSFVSVTEGER